MILSVYACALAVSQVSVVASAYAAGGPSPQTFTYQGRLLDNSAGGGPLTGNVDLVFGIYDPSGHCLIYEEKQTGVTLTSDGIFSVSVGSPTTDPLGKRTVNDLGKTMAQAYANDSTAVLVPHGANCSPAGGYTPASGDVRMLRVTVTSGSDTQTLSPDQPMDSAPHAWVAETLQGVGPTGFVQVAGNVSQATMNTLTGAGDASTLHNHDSLYARIGGTGPQSFGSGGIYTTTGGVGVGTSAAPTGVQLSVKTSGAGVAGLQVQGSAAQTADLVDVKDSTGAVLFSIDSAGKLHSATAVGNITTADQLTTKAYVDNAVASVAPTGYVSKLGDSIGYGAIAGPTGGLIVAGKVGIGTTGPTMALDVNAGAAAFFVISGNDAGVGVLATPWGTRIGDGLVRSYSKNLSLAAGSATEANTAVTFLTSDTTAGNTEKMRIDHAGNVGIGTTGPADMLQVYNSTAKYGIIAGNVAPPAVASGPYIRAEGRVYAGDGTAALPAFAFGLAGQEDNGIFRPANDNLGFSTAGSERMRIDASGNVGISATSPHERLEVTGGIRAGAAPASSTPITVNALSGDLTLTVANTAGYPSAGVILVENEAIAYTSITSTTFAGLTRGAFGTTAAGHVVGKVADAALIDAQADGTKALFMVTSAGRVGVGTATPSAQQEIWSNATGNVGLAVRGIAGQTADLQQWQDSTGAVLAKVDKSGVFTASGGLSAATGSITAPSGYVSSGSANLGLNFPTASSLSLTTASGKTALSAGAGANTVLQSDGGTTSVVVKQVSGQTGDLLQLQNSSGTPIFKVDASGNLTLANATAATAGNNYSSNTFAITGNYWNGSASAVDSWTMQDVLGTGTNPTSTLTIGHVGSTGSLGVVFPSSSVGIGTSSPGFKLSVTDSSANTMLLARSSGDGTVANTAAVGRLMFGTVNTTSGINNPTASITGVATEAWTIGSAQGTALAFTSVANGTTAPTEAMRIDNNGRVGIGTTGPSYMLDVVGTANVTMEAASSNTVGTSFAITNTSTGGHSFQFFSTGSTNGNGVGNFGVFDGTANKTPLNIVGNTGLITTISGGMWGWSSGSQYASNTADTAFARNAAGVVEINNGTAGTYRDLQLRAINPSSGNLGIGTTSPSGLLHAVNNANSDNPQLYLSNANATGGAGIMINRTVNSRAGQIQFATAGTTDWYMGELRNGGSPGSTFSIGTGSDTNVANPALTITGSGNIGIGAGTGTTHKIQVDTAVNNDGIYLTAGGNTTAALFNNGGTNGRLSLFNSPGGTQTISIASVGGSYFNAGNVAIGSISPAEALDVTGTVVGGLNGAIVNSVSRSPAFFPSEGSPSGGGKPGVFGYGGPTGVTVPTLANYGSVGIVGAADELSGSRMAVGVHGYTTQTAANSISNNATYGVYGLADLGAAATDFKGEQAGVYGVAQAGAGGYQAGANVYGGKFSANGAGAAVTYGGYFTGGGGTTNYGVYSAGGTNYFNGNVGVGVSGPNSALQVNGPIATTVAVKSTAYTLTTTDSVVLGNASGGAFTLTLPTAVGVAGRQYTIKKTDTSTNAVTVTAVSGNIDGVASYLLYSPNDVLVVVSDGTNWYAIEQPRGDVSFNVYNTTASLSPATMTFTGVTFNNGAAYSTGTGKFTAPVAGVYHLEACMQLNVTGAANRATVGITKNAGGLAETGVTTVSGLAVAPCVSTTINAAAGDYFQVYSWSGTTATVSTGLQNAFFSGYRVH